MYCFSAPMFAETLRKASSNSQKLLRKKHLAKSSNTGHSRSLNQNFKQITASAGPPLPQDQEEHEEAITMAPVQTPMKKEGGLHDLSTSPQSTSNCPERTKRGCFRTSFPHLRPTAPNTEPEEQKHATKPQDSTLWCSQDQTN